MASKKRNLVAPENQPHNVGVLAPWGGAAYFKPEAYCRVHKYHHEGKLCPICENTE